MPKHNEFPIEDIDLRWLGENFPGLNYVENKPSNISGELNFGMEYYPDKKSFDVFQFKESAKSKKNLIYDTYQIEIDLKKTAKSLWPKVFETGKRVPREADFHCYADGHLCLTTFLEEAVYSRDGFKLEKFITNIVVPAFYEQSYYEKYGRWPWGEYSHGVIGLLESFSKVNKEISFYKKLDVLYKVCGSRMLDTYLNKNVNPYSILCPCGSFRNFYECHKEGFKGYLKLREFRDDVFLNPINLQLARSYFDPTNILMIQGWRY